MAHAVAVGTVQVRAVVDGVHLVDAEPGEPVGVRFDGVEEGDRFAVGERHDDVGRRSEVVEHGLRRRRHGCRHRQGLPDRADDRDR